MSAGSGLSRQGAGQPPKPLAPAQGPASAGSSVRGQGQISMMVHQGKSTVPDCLLSVGVGCSSLLGRLQPRSLGSIRRRKLHQGTIVPLVNQALGFSNQWFSFEKKKKRTKVNDLHCEFLKTFLQITNVKQDNLE